jgi:hypothetical protein
MNRLCEVTSVVGGKRDLAGKIEVVDSLATVCALVGDSVFIVGESIIFEFGLFPRPSKEIDEGVLLCLVFKGLFVVVGVVFLFVASIFPALLLSVFFLNKRGVFFLLVLVEPGSLQGPFVPPPVFTILISVLTVFHFILASFLNTVGLGGIATTIILMLF